MGYCRSGELRIEANDEMDVFDRTQSCANTLLKLLLFVKPAQSCVRMARLCETCWTIIYLCASCSMLH